jgi:hypothetical protein
MAKALLSTFDLDMRTVIVARNGRSPEHATVEIAQGCNLVSEDVRLLRVTGGQ